MCCGGSKSEGGNYVAYHSHLRPRGILSVPAKADETVKWRHVHHYASNQSQQVGNGHVVGVVRLPGIAFFSDGTIGTSLVIGTYDAVPGSGSTGGGYYTVTFADGSELWLT